MKREDIHYHIDRTFISQWVMDYGTIRTALLLRAVEGWANQSWWRRLFTLPAFARMVWRLGIQGPLAVKPPEPWPLDDVAWYAARKASAMSVVKERGMRLKEQQGLWVVQRGKHEVTDTDLDVAIYKMAALLEEQR